MGFLDFLTKPQRGQNQSRGQEFLSFLNKAVQGVQGAINPISSIAQSKPVQNIGKDIIQSIPRAGASVGLSLTKPLLHQDTFNPSQQTGLPGKLARTLYGAAPVHDIGGYGQETLGQFGVKNTNPATNFGIGGAVIASNFLPGGEGAKQIGLDTLSKAGTALTALGEAKKAAEPIENVTKKLIQQAHVFSPEVTPTKRVGEALTSGNLAKTTSQESRWNWLNSLKNSQNVAAKYFGDVGSTAVYKLSEGAKTVADIQEKLQPAIQETQKLLDKAAKTSVGKSEVQSRIYSALEDRANAGNYLKNDNEKKLFDATAQILDFFKTERQSRGLGVLENYSPRTAISDALTAPERLLGAVRGKFSTSVISPFSKERTLEEPVANIDKNIVNLLPSYVSSQAKEFGYKDALDYFVKNYDKTNPAFLLNDKNRRIGEKYLGSLFEQTLNPAPKTGAQKFVNRLVGQTYKSALSFNPRFALVNKGQKILTNSEIDSKLFGTGAKDIYKAIDKPARGELLKGLTSGDVAYTGEAESLTGKIKQPNKLDFAVKSEQGNIHDAYLKGVGQTILESDPYKTALAQGAKKADAVKAALADPNVKAEAIQRGNNVVQSTQFGQNAVQKPEFFRNMGVAKTFGAQYLRFPTGIAEHFATRVLNPKAAQELDLIKSGNPEKVKLVDFKKTLQALDSGTGELIKAIKHGESDVPLQDAQTYGNLVKSALKQANKDIGKASSVSRGKTLAQYAKLYAYSVAVQSIFTGGINPKALTYALPFNTPQQGQSVLDQAFPAVPFIHGETTKQNLNKLTNFVPVLGPVAARARQIQSFAKTLSGGNK